MHGLLDTPAALTSILQWAGLREVQTLDVAAQREAALDRLADTLEQHLDLATVFGLLGLDLGR